MNTGKKFLVATKVRIVNGDLFVFRQDALERDKKFRLLDVTKIAVRGGDSRASQSIDKYVYVYP
jgi:hypothetical protein